MDLQILIDRILETENLTDNLEDPEASRLLDWGVSHLPEAVQDAASQRAANARANHLMAVIRTVNQLVGNRAYLAPEELDSGLKEIGERFQRAFGRVIPAADPTRRQEIVGQLPQLTSPQAVDLMLDLFK